MSQYRNGKSRPDIDLPALWIVKTTSKGDKGIRNHKYALSEFPDTENVEREILVDMKERIDHLSILLELRLQEI